MQRTPALARLPRHLFQRQLRRTRAPTTASTHSFSTSVSHRNTTPFGSGPSPPRLPKEEQEIFERLQRQSTGAFSTPRDSNQGAANPSTSTSSFDIRSRINQSPDSSPSSSPSSPHAQAQAQASGVDSIAGQEVEEQFHPNLRRGAPPEFEGDVNPKTGEVGGPKTEPLRWGSHGDYSFNGRVTDF